MSLEAKIQELTEAVDTLTGAFATLTTGMLGQKGATGSKVVTSDDEGQTKGKDPEETAAAKKKRETKEKRDAKRQEKIDKETAEAKAAEEADDGLGGDEPEAEEITPEILKKVALHLIKSSKKPEWLAALADTGCAKLTEVPAEERAALLDDIEGIAGKKHDEI